MRKLSLLFFIIFAFQQVLQAQINEPQELTVFLVRHAEKVDNSSDAQLSEAGLQRAKQLAKTLKDAQLNYVYSTNYIRTRETAKPCAKHFSCDIQFYDPHKLDVFAGEIRKKQGRILIVGHSNTTPRLVELLGGEPGIPIAEKDEYDRLYILNIKEQKGTCTVLLRYGE